MNNVITMESRVRVLSSGLELSDEPKFPNKMLIEVSNACNHACSFCAYTTMERPNKIMNYDLFKKIIKEAIELKVEEFGLHGGSEPLTCKNIEEYISFAKSEGAKYVYISTNGSIGNKERMESLLDSGLDSIKFSVNAGNRESYKNIHGKDSFEKVIENIKHALKYRKENNINIKIMISFVETLSNKGEFSSLKDMFKNDIDEYHFSAALNQSGQMDGEGFLALQDIPGFEICWAPFNQITVTVEGYLRACCNDYNNLLVLDNLKNNSLYDGWNTEQFKKFRLMHINDSLEHTLCYTCIKNKQTEVKPLLDIL